MKSPTRLTTQLHQPAQMRRFFLPEFTLLQFPTIAIPRCISAHSLALLNWLPGDRGETIAVPEVLIGECFKVRFAYASLTPTCADAQVFFCKKKDRVNLTLSFFFIDIARFIAGARHQNGIPTVWREHADDWHGGHRRQNSRRYF